MSKTTIEDAALVLQAALRNNQDVRNTYLCAISKAFRDEYEAYVQTHGDESINRGAVHIISARGAAKFLAEYTGSEDFREGSHDFENQEDVDRIFDDFWRPILTGNGDEVDLELVKKELYDYHFVMCEVVKVYDHITNSTLTKPNYKADSVISVYENCVQDAIKQAISEQHEEDIVNLKAAVDSMQSADDNLLCRTGFEAACKSFKDIVDMVLGGEK